MSGVTGALTLGKKSLVTQNCGSAIGQADDHRCNPTGLEAVQSAKSLGLVSTVSFAAGLASVGTGLVLLLTDHKPATTKAGTSGRWISAEVLPAGQTGAMLGVRGAW